MAGFACNACGREFTTHRARVAHVNISACCRVRAATDVADDLDLDRLHAQLPVSITQHVERVLDEQVDRAADWMPQDPSSHHATHQVHSNSQSPRSPPAANSSGDVNLPNAPIWTFQGIDDALHLATTQDRDADQEAARQQQLRQQLGPFAVTAEFVRFCFESRGGRGQSDADINRLLRLLWHPSFHPEQLLVRTAQNCKAFAEAQVQQVDFVLYSKVLTAGEGRIYATPDTCMLWNDVQALLPEGATCAMLVFFSDSTPVNEKGQSCWPISVSLFNIAKRFRNKDAKWLVGYLPTLRPLPKRGLGRKSRQFKWAKLDLLHRCLEIVLGPIKAMANGEVLVNANGERQLVYPFLASWITDWSEGCKLLCHKDTNGCNYPCHWCMCPREELSDLSSIHEERTIEAMKHTWAIAVGALQSGQPLCNIQAMLSKVSYSQVVKCSLWDLPFGNLPIGNAHLAITLERMHQAVLGVYKDLTTLLVEYLKDKDPTGDSIRTIEARLDVMKCPALRIPFGYLTTDVAVTANEHAATMQVMPYATYMAVLVSHGDNLVDEVTPLFVAFSEFYMIANRKGVHAGPHTDLTLAKLAQARAKFDQLAKERLGPYQLSNWNTVKYHALKHYEQCIKRLGPLDEYDAQSWEEDHKNVAHKPYSATNKHARTVMQQMVRRVVHRQSLGSALGDVRRSWNAVSRPRHEHPKQRNKARHIQTPDGLGDHAISSRRKVLDLQGLREGQPADVASIKRLQEQPELVHLPLAARRYLLELEGRRGVRGDAALWDNLPCILGDKVYVYNSVRLSPTAAAASRGRSGCSMLRANFCSYYNPVFDDVVVRGVDAGNGNDVKWYGQVRLLFLMANTRREWHMCAFVRWYVEFGRVVPHLGQRRLKWAQRQGADWYDVVALGCIERVAHIVPDFSAEDGVEHFFINQHRH
eukprot:jgi/Chlat1/8609/Chrsp86S08002